MLSPKELSCWHQEKTALFGQAVIPESSKEVWLMYNVDAQCTLKGVFQKAEKENQH